MGMAYLFESMIMMPRFVYVVFITAYLSGNLGIAATEDSSEARNGKHFSLFSVVTFKNDACTSESSIAGGARKGTCYATTECSDKSGTASGNCASGFGVCCVFLNTAAVTATISENRTHLRNSEYPSYTTATAATTIVYTINKMQSDICQVRLDFTSFVLAGPANSKQAVTGTSYNHNCINDQIRLASTGNTNMYPMMCGTLTGEHLYIELSPTASDAATITLKQIIVSTAPVAATAKRLWDVYTQQIPCYADYRAPEGCHRYLTTDYGKITSLNFYKISGSTPASNGQNSGLQLASQHLNTCIRRSKGMCCVQYLVCILDTQSIELTDEAGTLSTTLGTEGIYNEGFSIDTAMFQGKTEDWADVGAFDAMCSTDYVEVPSSFSGPCGSGTRTGGTTNTRYCGSKFGAHLILEEALANACHASSGVCDCSQPWLVRHGSDMSSDIGGDTAVDAVDQKNTLVTNRGFCLDFLQQPCIGS